MNRSPVFIFSLVLLAVSPAALGSSYPWGYYPLSAGVGFLLVGWAWRVLTGKETSSVSLRSVMVAAVPFFVVAVWAFVQSSSLVPRSLAHPFWQEVGNVLGTDPDNAISVDPFKTREALMRFLAYGGVFWLFLQYGRDRRMATEVLSVLAGIGLLYALYGLLITGLGLDVALWFKKVYAPESLSSTFLNRNSYALYAILTCLAAIARLHMIGIQAGFASRDSRARLLMVLMPLLRQGCVYIITIPVVIVAVLLTHSRSGAILLVLGIAAYSVALTLSGKTRLRWALLWFCIAGLVIVTAYGLGDTMLSWRFQVAPEEWEMRAAIYAQTLEAIAETGWLGTGYGTFADVFQMYRPLSMTTQPLQAHNTYLENTLELGLPIGLLQLAMILALAAVVFRGLLRRRQDTPFLALGLAATVVVGTQALVDFGIQTPSIAATYAALLGIAYGQSWSSRVTSL
jgi:hypothetical protein